MNADLKGQDLTKLNKTEARQGSWGKPVLYVLVAGLVLAGIGAITLEAFDADEVTADIGGEGPAQ
ncbi:hypothetical protein E0D97_05955 [Oricola cellulosilytica]|uniref:Uncharacterized protein n=1 Tax=Oricola cellulosilytica TaxID=1429082 RepID=A0A4R0PCA4_9HYPH|nr:hypothetical protein E0D97_05955 [Oricola cellulosilytica]